MDEYFAKETVYHSFEQPDGTLDEFSRNRTSFTQNTQESQVTINGTRRYIGYVDVIGSKIVGVYLGNANEFDAAKSPILERWTELFLDLGHHGCLNIQSASSPSGWPFFTELEDSLQSHVDGYDSSLRIMKVLPIFE